MKKKKILQALEAVQENNNLLLEKIRNLELQNKELVLKVQQLIDMGYFSKDNKDIEIATSASTSPSVSDIHLAFVYPTGYDAVIFADGSFNPATKKCGYGIVITAKQNVLKRSKGTFPMIKNEVPSSTSAELYAVYQAANLANISGYSNICIVYDCAAVEETLDGKNISEARRNWTYKKINKFKEKMRISLLKVKAHTGVAFHEKADMLARTSVEAK